MIELSAADRRTLSALRITSRLGGSGVLFGAHAGRRTGSGVEFSHYRAYNAGDDPRLVDWKLLGRSDRYFVRQSDTETSLAVRIVVDATASMAHEELGRTKLQQALTMAAGIGFVALRQGDQVQLIFVRDGEARPGLALRGAAQSGRMLGQLQQVTPHGRWPTWQRMAQPFSLGLPGITYCISDGHDADGRMADALVRLAKLGHDVRLLLVVAPDEEHVAYDGSLTFEDLETGERLESYAPAIRAESRALLEQARQQLGRGLARVGISVQRVGIAEPLASAMMALVGHTHR